MTALHMAARAGSVEMIQDLIAAHAVVDRAEPDDLLTPLHIACYRGHLGATKELIARGATLTLQDGWGRTPLAAACLTGRLDIVEATLDSYDEAARMRGLVDAAANGHIDVVEL